MWRRNEALLLRLGRTRVELWRGAPGRLAKVAVQALAGPLVGEPRPEVLAEALAALWPQADLLRPGQGRGAAVTAIVESAWMPVTLLATGPGLWRTAEVTALARHRLGEIHGPPAARWQLRIDHRPGDAHGLAFGLAPEVLDALRSACEAVSPRLELVAVQPALAWGFNATRSLVPTRNVGWWLWPEQDRHLLARVDRGGITGLHPALPAVLALTGRGGIAQAIEVERQRLGERDDGLGVVAGSWAAQDVHDASLPFVQWVTLVGSAA